MKHLLFIISFCATLFCPLLYADQGMNMMVVEGGMGYHLSSADSTTLLTPVLTLGVRHFYYNNAFVQVRLNTWSKEGHSATWIGPSAGYRHHFFSNRVFFEESLGYGYLTKPDGNFPDGKGSLTTNQQFEITFGAGFYTNKNSEFSVGIAHLSNCSNICNRNDSFEPNPGKNWYRMSYGVHF